MLTGSIPAGVSAMTLLSSLRLADNSLTGTISSTLGGLVNLAALDLSNNGFMGTIPSSVSVLTQLTFLGFANNGLGGAFPTFLGSIANLAYVLTASVKAVVVCCVFPCTSVSDARPDVCYCHNCIGSVLLLGGNHFIPTSFSSAVNVLPQHLGYLDLSSLPLTGTVPTALSRLSAVT